MRRLQTTLLCRVPYNHSSVSLSGRRYFARKSRHRGSITRVEPSFPPPKPKESVALKLDLLDDDAKITASLHHWARHIQTELLPTQPHLLVRPRTLSSIAIAAWNRSIDLDVIARRLRQSGYLLESSREAVSENLDDEPCEAHPDDYWFYVQNIRYYAPRGKSPKKKGYLLAEWSTSLSWMCLYDDLHGILTETLPTERWKIYVRFADVLFPEEEGDNAKEEEYAARDVSQLVQDCTRGLHQRPPIRSMKHRLTLGDVATFSNRDHAVAYLDYEEGENDRIPGRLVQPFFRSARHATTLNKIVPRQEYIREEEEIIDQDVLHAELERVQGNIAVWEEQYAQNRIAKWRGTIQATKEEILRNSYELAHPDEKEKRNPHRWHAWLHGAGEEKSKPPVFDIAQAPVDFPVPCRLQIDFEEHVQQTLFDATHEIRQILESTFEKPEVHPLIGDDSDIVTHHPMPLEIVPRSKGSFSIPLLRCDAAIEALKSEELQEFHSQVTDRLMQSGFIHDYAHLPPDLKAHPNDFWFIVKEFVTFPSDTRHLLVANLRASPVLESLYEDLHHRTHRHFPSLRHWVDRSVPRLRDIVEVLPARNPIWQPRIILADIRKGMQGCKKEEKLLQDLLKVCQFGENNEFFQPVGISLAGNIPQQAPLDWNYSFKYLRNPWRFENLNEYDARDYM